MIETNAASGEITANIISRVARAGLRKSTTLYRVGKDLQVASQMAAGIVESSLVKAQMSRSNCAGLPSLDFYFIWVPKCAGTTVFQALHESTGMLKIKSPKLVRQNLGRLSSMRSLTTGHMEPDILINLGISSAGNLNQANSIGIVRNPFNRVFSLFSHFNRLSRFAPKISLIDFLRGVERDGHRLGPWNSSGVSAAQPMVRWLKPALWDGPKTILRFENLHEDIQGWGQESNLNITLGCLNSNPSSSEHSWSRAEIEMVQRLYEEDFVAYGYAPLPE